MVPAWSHVQVNGIRYTESQQLLLEISKGNDFFRFCNAKLAIVTA